MATTLNLDSTFSGKWAGDYIRSAFQANDTLQGITLKENIEYKAVVKRLADDVDFGAANCSFNPLGTINITERVLELKKFQVQRQICVNDFLQDWNAKDAQNGDLGTALSEALTGNILEGVAAKNETYVWTGDSTNTNQYDGLLTLIGQDAGGDINFVSTPVNIDSTNVIAKINATIALMPAAVKGATEKPTLYVSTDVWEAFMIASAASGNGWYTYGGAEVPKTYLGMYKFHVCPGLPDSSIVMARPSNLWFGTNLVNDWNNITIADMRQFGEDNVRFSLKFFAGAQYGIGSEIVAYSTWF